MSNTRKPLSIAPEGAIDLSAVVDTSRQEEIQKRLLSANLATSACANAQHPVSASVWSALATEIYKFITVE